MLNHLDENSTLDIIVPAKITLPVLVMKARLYNREFLCGKHVSSSRRNISPGDSYKTYLFSVTSLLKNKSILELSNFKKRKLISEINRRYKSKIFYLIKIGE